MSLISGNVIFSGVSINLSQNPNAILGLSTFLNTSINSGIINSGCFLDNSINLGCVIHTVSFYGNSINSGVISGNAEFGDTAKNCGTVSGNAIFSGYSVNESLVHGTAQFDTNATNNGTVDNYVPPNHIYQHGSYWSDDATLINGSILYTGRYTNNLAANVSFSQDGNAITTNGSGVVTVSSSKSWSVSGDNNGGTLYTSNSVTDLDGATIYTNSALNNTYNSNMFTYNGAVYDTDISGIASVRTWKQWNIDNNGGYFYTSIETTDLNGATIYTNTALSTPNVGISFVISGVKYASNGSALVNSYKSWNVSYANYATLYTAVSVQSLDGASNVYSNALLTTSFTDDFTISGTSYTYSNGTYGAASYKIWAVSDDDNSGILYTSNSVTDINFNATVHRAKELNYPYSLNSFTYNGIIYDTTSQGLVSERAWKAWSVSNTNVSTLYTLKCVTDLQGACIYTDSGLGNGYIGGSFTYGTFEYDDSVNYGTCTFDMCAGTPCFRNWRDWSVIDCMSQSNTFYTCYNAFSLLAHQIYYTCQLDTTRNGETFTYCGTCYCTDSNGCVSYL